MIDEYESFWSSRPFFETHHIFELGIWEGGSIAFWSEYFRPKKHVGIDIKHKQDSKYFQRYITSRRLGERIKTYWGTKQEDSKKIRQIVENEFSGPLDLVIDDASHMYEFTKISFETLFPFVRSGGLYVIEDWAWSHWGEFQELSHPWSRRTPLTKLIFELVEATGSSRALIGSVSIFQGFVVIERGEIESARLYEFRVENFISRRPEVPWYQRIRKKKTK